MRFSYYIASRYLRSRRHSWLVNLVSVLAVVGIVLGVMVLNLTLAIMNGFHAELRRTFVDNMPMITIRTSDPAGFTNLGAVVDTIASEPGVVGVAPFIRQEVILTTRRAYGAPRHKGAVIWGIDPALQESVTPLTKRVLPAGSALELLRPRRAGTDAEPGETPRILLGSELATSLVAGLRDTIVVTAPRGELDLKLDQLEAESRHYLVSGFFETGMYEFDSRFAYLGLDEARDFFGYGPQGAFGIGIKVADMMSAPVIGDHLEHRLGKNRFHAIDWISMNQNLFKWIQLEKVIMFLLLALVVVVAAFNIIGILTMMIGERSREIGILMSMGAKRRQILGIFVLDGLFLGMVGTLAGSFLAWLGALYLKKFGFELPGDVYFLDHVPVVVQGTDFLAVGGAAVLISIVFTIIPSWLAARLKPIEIIRYT